MFRYLISHQDEEIKAVVKRSLWFWFYQIILAALCLVLPFFLIYPLFQFDTAGAVAFLVILFLALTLILRIYLTYANTALVITNKRMIDTERSGFFSQETNSIIYGKIQDVNFQSRGVIRAILRLGDIYITMAGDKSSVIKLPWLGRPHRIVAVILSQREAYLQARRATTNNEALILLKKIKSKLGDRRFEELISD